MHQALLDTKKFIFDTLFPLRCIHCQTAGQFICSGCLANLSRVQQQVCIQCQKPSLLGVTHPKCLTPQSPNMLLSLYNYKDSAVARSIIYGKYKFIPGIFSVLADELASFLRTLALGSLPKQTYLVPLPLASSRKRWRGFNQAEILTQALALKLALPVSPLLARPVATKTQKDLTRQERLQNVHNAFSLATKAPKPLWQYFIEPKHNTVPQYPEVAGNNFIIIDDVVTTGSTLKEATKVLKRSGAKNVMCITVARD